MTEAKKETKSTSYVAAQRFDAELHKKDVSFKAGEDIPGNVSETTLNLWKERGLIKVKPD